MTRWFTKFSLSLCVRDSRTDSRVASHNLLPTETATSSRIVASGTLAESDRQRIILRVVESRHESSRPALLFVANDFLSLSSGCSNQWQRALMRSGLVLFVMSLSPVTRRSLCCCPDPLLRCSFLALIAHDTRASRQQSHKVK